MTTDSDSAKLCDKRLLSLDTITLTQSEMSYSGIEVEGRKYPVLSSAENETEKFASNEKLFIFGGFDNSYKIVNDRGYYMYDIPNNTMIKLDYP
jgi:hypothetical protein